MQKARLEQYARWGMVGLGFLVSLAYAYSLWSPGSRGAETDSGSSSRHGRPKMVITKYQAQVTNYAEASIYPAELSDFTKDQDRFLIMPTEVSRFEHEGSTATTQFRQRKGSRRSNPQLEPGRDYALQFDCPPDMKSIKVSYDGRLMQLAMWEDPETGKIIAKGQIRAKPGSNALRAEVIYYNGGKDIFDIIARGEQ